MMNGGTPRARSSADEVLFCEKWAPQKRGSGGGGGRLLHACRDGISHITRLVQQQTRQTTVYPVLLRPFLLPWR